MLVSVTVARETSKQSANTVCFEDGLSKRLLM